MTHQIILGTGQTAPLPENAKTIGEAATLLATQHHLGGTNFTLKIDGTPTPASTNIDTIKPGATLELIEHTPTTTPTPTPAPTPAK